MIVHISSDAEADIREGYWFYEKQNEGQGNYFRDYTGLRSASRSWRCL